MTLDNITILGYAWPKWMPQRRDNQEIWLLNQGYRLPWVDMNGVDRWFEMHRREKLETDKHAALHILWLKEEHPFPIYMTQKWEDFPASVEYPLNKVSNELLGEFVLRMMSEENTVQPYYCARRVLRYRVLRCWPLGKRGWRLRVWSSGWGLQ